MVFEKFEKVIITKCDLIMNGNAHGVTLSDGRQCTAWNDKINAGLLMQHFASHQPILMEIKPYVSKAGKAGLNVVAIGEDTQPAVMQEKVSSAVEEAIKKPNFSGSERDMSIVAQMCVKTAGEIVKHGSFDDQADAINALGTWTQECVGAYKLALSALE